MRTFSNANLPIFSQSHLAGHIGASFTLVDVEELVDNFSFFVVMDSCLRSLIQLRKGSELCGLQARNLGPKSRDFRL